MARRYHAGADFDGMVTPDQRPEAGGERGSIPFPNRMTGLVLVCFSCLAAILLFGLCSTSVERDTVLALVGVTNIPARGPYAILSCTNHSSKVIAFFVDSFDDESSGTWRTNRLDDGRGSLTTEARSWVSRFIGTPSRLAPNEGAIFYAPSPVTNAAWRARFMCAEMTLLDRLKTSTGSWEASPRTIVSGKGNKEFFSGRRYKLVSPDIPK
jgi:hypothetical protein